MVMERVNAASAAELSNITLAHLDKFAGDGLRTLCLAYKEIPQEFFDEWQKRQHQVKIWLIHWLINQYSRQVSIWATAPTSGWMFSMRRLKLIWHLLGRRQLRYTVSINRLINQSTGQTARRRTGVHCQFSFGEHQNVGSHRRQAGNCYQYWIQLSSAYGCDAGLIN